MHVVVNGEVTSCGTQETLEAALLRWGYRLDLPMAIAVNDMVIHKPAYSQYVLKSEDSIEILMPMQGG